MPARSEMRVLLRRALPADATAPRLARAALAELPPGVGADRGHLQLMVSELVTNSVRHAGLAPSDRIQLEVLAWGPGIRVQVRDPGSGYEMASRALDTIPLPPHHGLPLAEGGFGLAVVAALA